MLYEEYLNLLNVKGKKHLLLIATPKGEYPNQYSNEYFDLETSLLANPDSYIDLFEEGKKEIMQYVAFRLYLKSFICDDYRLQYKTTEKLKRFSKDQVESFFVVKEFFNTFPNEEKEEIDAINDGLSYAKTFFEKYPFDKFEFATVQLGKDSDEANVFLKLDLKNDSNNYYFDYVYVR